MSIVNSKRDWGTFFLYAFGFVLLWEWIRPLEALTDTEFLNVFIFYIFLSFVLAFFHARIWIIFPIKVLYILYCVYVFYFKGEFFSSMWLKEVFVDMIENFGYVISGEWIELTNVFRTVMFFVLLWLMTYLIHYWLLNRKRIFLFFVVTLIYITVLDTFTPYSAKDAIIRTIVTGFAAMGILTLNRILTKENIGRDFSFSKRWMTILSCLIVLSVSVGLIAPKAEPIWPDPVPFIKSLNDKSGGGTHKIGYGIDDSQLGGDFVGDDKVVFRAEVESKQYWRVETKDVYTGKGWIVSTQRITVPIDSEVPIYSFEGDVEVREQDAIIYPYISYPHIVYPFGVSQVHAEGNKFEFEPITEKVFFDNKISNAKPYSLTYKVPRYSVTKLKQVTSSEQARLDRTFVNRYTFVPASVPSEVKTLALEITEGQVNWFDKARAIEKYFDRSEFSYSQKDVAIPERDEDYVAQFLFDTKVGYCDNFSTSMAVMLRTLGIPTRWVKGYTGGEYKQLGSNSRKVYEVTNNNAHSWVEVYFPGSGWLAFEPTPGYTNNVSLNFDTYKEDAPKAETPLPEKKPEPVKKDLKEEVVNKENSKFSFKAFWLKIKIFLNEEWKWIFFGGLALVMISLIVYRKRPSWMPHYLIWKFKYKKKDESFSIAYLALLKQLELYGLRRKHNQTLREYAKYVDSFFSTKEMSRLTERYELLLYKGTLNSGSWVESKELWENLIKKTIA
ncbi:MAG TPA: transglutaminaseTgpA domain-containing protein [Pseudoneobacillus sp.]|nr:transglutaminaseTgpA domain-containing protein [Pseudoneobacillus sp.]